MSAIELEVGVGQCSKRPDGFGHVWEGAQASGDESNPCRFCGTSGRVFFQEWCARRMLSFAGVRMPFESGTGVEKKAWPNGAPPENVARAAAVVADKKRRDAEKGSRS